MKKFLTALATAGLLIGVLGIPTAKPVKAVAPEVLFVSKSGSLNLAGVGSCKNADYHNIQDAIDNSVDDQVIVICPGIWKLSSPLSTDETTGLTLQGISTAKTVLDGQKISQVLVTDNSGGWGSVTLRTMTVQNGYGNADPAVTVGDFACDRVLFKNNVNKDNYFRAIGGALSVNGDATFSQCAFQGNVSYDIGGAAYVAGSLDDHNSTYTQNTAGAGGALYINDGDDAGSSIVGSTFTKNRAVEYFQGNDAEGDGGAVLYNAEGTLNVVSSIFKSNYAGNDGGAIDLGDNGDEGYLCDYDVNFCEETTGGTLVATSSVFIANVADTKSDYNEGGAICHEDSEGFIESYGSTYQQNQSGSDGGAIYGDGYITIIGNRFVGNRSFMGNGGAVFAYYDFLSDPSANFYRGNVDQNGANDWDID